MEQINKPTAVAVGIIGAVSAFAGWFGWLAILLASCMTLDFLTGTGAAIQRGEYKTKVASNGLWRKLGTIVAVLAAIMLDVVIELITTNIPALNLPFNYAFVFSPIVMVWYILTECGSILENAAAMGTPIPPFLLKVVEWLGLAAGAAGDTLAPDSQSHKEDNNG